MIQTEGNALFSLEGRPPLGQALPLAIQHVVSMIVGCVSPALIIATSSGLSPSDSVVLVQSALLGAAVASFIQLFPPHRSIGSGLPMMMGVSFAYLSNMLAISQSFSIAAIFGAQLVGGVIAVLVGLSVQKIRFLFPPLITGTVVFTIGLSLYPTAIHYMAGGKNSVDYGSWENWTIAIISLTAVTGLNHFSRGMTKLASILIGIVFGYIISIPFGMVQIQAVIDAPWFQLPHIAHFGIDFEPSACAAIGILFAINAIQAIGDFSATTVGGLYREPSDGELRGGIIGHGLSNMFCALIGGLPVASYSQNVGIVTSTKVVNRHTLGLGATIILLAGLVPKFSALLTTIPQAVLGGATVSVFASIAMTGMKLVVSEPLNYRNTSIVGLAAALGMGISQASGALSHFPQWFIIIFAKSPVVIASIVAVILNLILPKSEDEA